MRAIGCFFIAEVDEGISTLMRVGAVGLLQGDIHDRTESREDRVQEGLVNADFIL